MNNNIRQEYEIALRSGYVYVASIVKSVFGTTYYHVVPIQDILSAGHWLPAVKGYYPTAKGSSTWHGRCGTSTLPDHTILRKEIYRRARAVSK